MKILIAIISFSLSLSISAQEKVIGRYRDSFGSRIQLNADNTFEYTVYLRRTASC